MRRLPIITFVNKVDRDGRAVFEIRRGWPMRWRSTSSRRPWPVGMGAPSRAFS